MFEQMVIFTDLDATLLDHHDYSWQPATQALTAAKSLQIPIIINTSKTRSEVETLAFEIGLNSQPYVVENGSAIIFPNIHDRLLSKIQSQSQYKQIDEQHAWVLGENRSVLCGWLNKIKKGKGYRLESYQDWSTEAIMKKTGLPKDKALASQKKEFSEPFQWFDTDEKLSDFIQQAESQGYCVLQGGRFYHLQGNVTKASVFVFFKTYQTTLFPKSSTLKFIALGDNHNDVDMLNRADIAICIKSPVNEFPQLSHPAAIYSHQYGAKGWNEEILKQLKIHN